LIKQEWHKGKIENVLNEQIIFKIGTVDHEKIEEYKKSFYESLQIED